MGLISRSLAQVAQIAPLLLLGRNRQGSFTAFGLTELSIK
jgi:hypothetical protein